MSVSMRPPDRSLVRRRSLIGFRTACEIMWGSEGVQRIAEALPSEVRERTASFLPLPEWLPVDDLIAWHMAVKEGPGQDEALFKQHVHVTVDQGFGKVKRLLLSIATPHTLAPRAAALWRDEYSSGRLEARPIDKRCVTLTLSDHPFVHHPLMRPVIAEAYRYIVSLTSAKIVTAELLSKSDELTVRMRWT
jgi:hypothetical protein